MTEPEEVTREELIARARALAPGIAERAEKAEQLRNVPDENLQEMVDAGLFRMLQPRRVGGYEMPFDILVDVVPIIGAACTSTAWILGNFSSRVASSFGGRKRWSGVAGVAPECTRLSYSVVTRVHVFSKSALRALPASSSTRAFFVSAST